MNLKGHLASSILVSDFFLLPFSESMNITKYIDISYIKKIDILFGGNNLNMMIFLSLFFIAGSIFPDLDQLLKNKYKHYTEYHRQLTHSLLLSCGLLGLVYYLNFVIVIPFINLLLVFLLGILFHIIIDVFFGKGGIPIFLYTKKWNNKYRLSIPFFQNDGVISNIIISFSYVLILFLLYCNYKNLLLDSFLFFDLFLLSFIKNTKTTFKYLITVIFLYFFTIIIF